VPETDWPEDAQAIALIRAQWDKRTGDARQELVLIGMAMDEAALRARFDHCLLSDAEMACGPAGWSRWPTPFADWDDMP
jgi:hypothetical protein